MLWLRIIKLGKFVLKLKLANRENLHLRNKPATYMVYLAVIILNHIVVHKDEAILLE